MAVYVPTNWQDLPSLATAINAIRLNNMETGISAAYVQGTGTLVNADIAAGAAIAKSKLASLAIVDADVSAGAALGIAKLAGYPTDATKFLRGDATWAVPPTPTSYRKTTAKTVNTTVAATDLLNGEITAAAGVMGATGLLRLTAWGDWKNNSGGAVAPPRIQLLLGGTTLFDTGATGTSADIATRYPWKMVATILNSVAAAQVVEMDFRADFNVVGGANAVFTTGTGNVTFINVGAFSVYLAKGVNTATVNTALASALVLNVINGSASATYETKLFGALVEII